MKRLTFILAGIFLVITAFGQSWVTFSDTAFLFTAKYPSNWTNKIKENKRVFFTSPADSPQDDFLENINISVTTNPDFGTKYQIKDVLQGLTGTLKNSFNDFQDEGQRIFQWNNQDAGEIIYSGYNKADTSKRVRMIQWFCFYKARLYTVTFTSKASTDKHTATALKIMSGILFRP